MILAFLFPGQGSQRVGMGTELGEVRPDLYDRYVGEAERETGLGLRRLCAEGPLVELTRTEVAQPAIFSLSVAIAALAREAGIAPDYLSGHSLGEYSAAVVGGALRWEDAIRLVALRGRLMAAAQANRPGGMAAISGLSGDTVENICRRAAVDEMLVVANFNSPGQHVISGEEPAVERAIELATRAGADQALRLHAGAAFHSPLMEPVQVEMARALAEVKVADSGVPIAVNHSGLLVYRGADLRAALTQQVTKPVRWVQCIGALIGTGCDSFLELGPGRVLTGLARQIDPDLDAFAADSPKKLDNFLAAHGGVRR